MTENGPARSPLAAGMTWASRITSLGLEFALPALGGVYLDRRFDTRPWATLIGAALGFGLGMWHVLKIAREGTSG